MTEYISDEAKQDACDFANKFMGGNFWEKKHVIFIDGTSAQRVLYALALKFQQTGDYPDKWTMEARKICAYLYPSNADAYLAGKCDTTPPVLQVESTLKRGAEMAGEV